MNATVARSCWWRNGMCGKGGVFVKRIFSVGSEKVLMFLAQGGGATCFQCWWWYPVTHVFLSGIALCTVTDVKDDFGWWLDHQRLIAIAAAARKNELALRSDGSWQCVAYVCWCNGDTKQLVGNETNNYCRRSSAASVQDKQSNDSCCCSMPLFLSYFFLAAACNMCTVAPGLPLNFDLGV